jgi:hypothetical protein
MIMPLHGFAQSTDPARRINVTRAIELLPELAALPTADVVLFLDQLYELAHVVVSTPRASGPAEEVHDGR